jgi:hypothetical protein
MVIHFLTEFKLKLKFSFDKIKIINIKFDYAKFLRHYIKMQTYSKHILDNIQYLNSIDKNKILESKDKPKILVSTELLKIGLLKNGFVKPNGKPKCCNKFIFLSDYEIISKYNSIIKGIINFYIIAENKLSLDEAIYILEYSAAHTLAAKHKTTISKIFKKYGKPIEIKIKDKEIKLITSKSQKKLYLNKKNYKVNNNSNKKNIT